jgi:hypothetical protein
VLTSRRLRKKGRNNSNLQNHWLGWLIFAAENLSISQEFAEL